MTFASLANLVVDAVDPRQTGEATGINTIMRTTVVTSEQIAGTSIPAESGYTTAFVMSAIAMGLAALAALAGPGRLRKSDVAAASPEPG